MRLWLITIAVVATMATDQNKDYTKIPVDGGPICALCNSNEGPAANSGIACCPGTGAYPDAANGIGPEIDPDNPADYTPYTPSGQAGNVANPGKRGEGSKNNGGDGGSESW